MIGHTSRRIADVPVELHRKGAGFRKASPARIGRSPVGYKPRRKWRGPASVELVDEVPAVHIRFDVTVREWDGQNAKRPSACGR